MAKPNLAKPEHDLKIICDVVYHGDFELMLTYYTSALRRSLKKNDWYQAELFESEIIDIKELICQY